MSEKHEHQPPRKHHYVPIFFTKRWAGGDGCVERFTKHGEIVDRHVPPARVGWELDLYRLPGENGPDSQLLEQRYFARVDHRASVALGKMLTTPIQTLNENDVGAWSAFVLSLMHRTPSYMAEMKRFGLDTWWATVRNGGDRYAELRSETDPDNFADYLDQRTDLEGELSVMRNIPNLGTSEAIQKFLAKAPWVHFNVPPGCPELLLSDSPIVMTNGIDNPGGHMALPLSPTRFLLIARDREAVHNIDRLPIRQLVKSLNKQVVESARHFVVSRDLRQAKFIRRHFGADPRPSIFGRATQGQSLAGAD